MTSEDQAEWDCTRSLHREVDELDRMKRNYVPEDGVLIIRARELVADAAQLVALARSARLRRKP